MLNIEFLRQLSIIDVNGPILVSLVYFNVNLKIISINLSKNDANL